MWFTLYPGVLTRLSNVIYWNILYKGYKINVVFKMNILQNLSQNLKEINNK